MGFPGLCAVVAGVRGPAPCILPVHVRRTSLVVGCAASFSGAAGSRMGDANTYWLVRHGRSRPNEAGIVISLPENGVKPEHGLSRAGKDQARRAGAMLVQQMGSAGGSAARNVHIYASDFSRARETAELVASSAFGWPPGRVEVDVLLRERCFGRALEHQADAPSYRGVWDVDARTSADDGYRVIEGDAGAGAEGGADADAGVESAWDVSERVAAAMDAYEARHQGSHVVLVSHGDLLSILRATQRARQEDCSSRQVLARHLAAHRDLALDNATLVPLGPW